MTDYEDQPQQSGGGGIGQGLAKRAGRKAAKHGGRKLLAVLGVKGIFWVLVIGLILLLIAAAGGALSNAAAAAPGPAATTSGAAGDGTWDAGNIISDAVFYNADTFPTVAAVQEALDRIGGSCTSSGCLRVAQYTPGPIDTAWCKPWSGPTGSQSFASLLYYLGKACGINPQVIIILIQKESNGLTRDPPPAALTGMGCPDTGPGGSANCDSSRSGVWAQTYGSFMSFARMRKDASRVSRYIEGASHDIMWNVAETGCGSAPVTVMNRATASLYTYTPYQPNDASLAAYPGEGDRCSAYGNRNFYRQFTKWFGSTGGGKPVASGAASAGGVNVAVNGVSVTIPDHPDVDPAVRGKVIQAPNAGMAKGLAAGFAQLGKPYVWGGWLDDGCRRGGHDFNACQGVGTAVGGSFDCSGLTAYVLMQGGFGSPGGNSGAQRTTGTDIAWANGLPGEIVGWSGHVAIYLGTIGGQQYILQASWVGTPIQIVPLTRSNPDPVLHRHWS